MVRKSFCSSLMALGAVALMASAANAQTLGAVSVAPDLTDTDISDWGANPNAVDTGDYITAGTVGPQWAWNDSVGDDTGDGDYTYLTDAGAGIDGTELDAGDFRFAYDTDNVYFLVSFPGDNSTFGELQSRFQIYIDRPGITTGSNTADIGNHRAFCQAFALDFDPSFNFDFVISNRKQGESLYLYKVDGDVSEFGNFGTKQEVTAASNGFIEISMPWSQLGGYPTAQETIDFVGVIGAADFGNIREVADTALEFNGGGGCAAGSAPSTGGNCYYDGDADVYDMIGVDAAAQETELTPTDCANDTFTALTTASEFSITLDPPPASLTLSSADAYFDNTYVRVLYNLPIDTSTTALDAANYTVTGSGTTTFTVAETGLGDVGGTEYLWLRLDNPIADADLPVTIAPDDSVVVANDGTPLATGASIDVTENLFIVPVSIDASGDGNEFLGNPFVVGGWDGFSFNHFLVDSGDPYPNIPFPTAEAGNVDDDVYQGRVWTTNDPNNQGYAVKSRITYDPSQVEPGKDETREYSVGYWNKYGYDAIYDSADGQINFTKPYVNRLLANTVTVTFQVQVPNTLSYFNTTQATDGSVNVYLMTGTNFGTSEGAVPTNPPGVVPTQVAAGDAYLLTYVDTQGGFHNYEGTADFGPLVPDVTTFRLAYTFDADLGDPGSPITETYEGGGATADDKASIIVAPDDPADFGAESAHMHVHRIASDTGSKALGRTIQLVFDQASLDVPPPPGDGLTNVENWSLY